MSRELFQDMAKQQPDKLSAPVRTSTVTELQGGLVAQVEVYNGVFNALTMGVIGVASRVDVQREGAKKLRDLLNQALPLTPAEIEALVPAAVTQELMK